MTSLANLHAAGSRLLYEVTPAGAWRWLTALTLESPAILGTSGVPVTGNQNNVSLGTNPVSLLRVYPGTGGAVVTGVVPQIDAQLLIVINDQVANGTDHVTVATLDGLSTNQNRFEAMYAGGVQQDVQVPGGCASAFLYRGPIGGSGRWRLLWLGGATLIAA